MGTRLCVLLGAGVALAALLGLAVYWSQVGFRLADTLGWAGAAVGTAGLLLAVYGMAASGQGRSAERPANVRMKARTSGKGRTYQAGGDQKIND